MGVACAWWRESVHVAQQVLLWLYLTHNSLNVAINGDLVIKFRIVMDGYSSKCGHVLQQSYYVATLQFV
jgi:hypothetical protein